MINKKIHYCWFGRNPLDEKATRCLESWKKFFPDYEIIQWNEDNFDISKIPFMKQAYQNKKYAFVSDVARLLVVYEHGGIYFDTDVEVIRTYDDIICDSTKAFMGIEGNGLVNTGLGFGAEKGHMFLKKHIELYKQLDFEEYRDHISDIACPILTTMLLDESGFIQNKKQVHEGIDIYPSQYFAPMDYQTGKLVKTSRTHSIHWYNASWQDENTRKEQEKLRKLSSRLGTKLAEPIYGILTCMRQEGIFCYMIRRIGKMFDRKVK